MKYLSTSSTKRSPLAIFALLAFVIVGTTGAFFVNSVSAAAGSTGTNSGSNFASVNNGAGSYNWTNPGNAVSSNGSYAFADLTTTIHPSDYLRAKGFGLSVPPSAIINGIEVQIERHQNCTAVVCILTSVKDDSVRLVKNGSIVGNDEASSTSWGTSDSIATYGGPSDLWGTTWTLAQINNVNSGMVLSAKLGGIIGARRANVDHITMKVYYYVPTPNAITGDATGITSSDATLNATNGDFASQGNSIWISDHDFSTAIPSMPAGVYSTPVFPPISANVAFSALLSSGSIPAGFPGVTPSTTYYYAAWSEVGGTWYPGAVKSFTTSVGSVTASINADSKTYDGTTNATTSCLLSGVVPAGADVGCSVSSASFADKNVGDGKAVTATGITLTGTAATNYTLTSNTATTTSSITKRDITVTAATDTKTYDTNTTSIGVPTITSGSLASGDSATWTQSFDTADVGTGKTLTPAGIVSDGNSDNNYNVTLAADTTGVIIPVAITVSADSQAKTYGDTDPALTYSVTSGALLGTDSFIGSLDRAVGENVGTYAIGQGTLSAGTNYSITYVGANFSINARDITITADAKAKTYGDPDPALTYQVTSGSLVIGDSFTGSLTRTAGEDVGGYLISQGTVSAGTNYNVSYISDNLTISEFETITVTVTAQTKTYGASDPTLTYTFSPALQGEDHFTGSLERVSGENVGTYAIGLGSLAIDDGNSGNNYALSFVGASLTITKADPIIVVTPYTVTYNGSSHTATGTATGVHEESLDGLVLTGTTHTNAGDYTEDSWAFTDSTGNYNNASGSIEDIIHKADATINVIGYTGTYDGLPHGVTGTATGVSEEDNLGEGLNLGTTFINVPGGTANWSFNGGTNYNNAEGSVAIVINKKSITVTADAKSKSVGDIDPTFTYTTTGLLGDDSVSGILTRESGETVGTYPIIQQEGENALNAGGNYVITYVGADLTIIPLQTSGGGGSGQNVIPRVHSSNGPLTVNGGDEGLLDQSFVDGSTIELDVPQGAVSTPVTFTVDSAPSAGFPPLDGSIVGNTFVITAVDADGNPVHNFNKDLNITIKGLHLGDISNINLYFFDPTTNTYVLVTSSGIDASGMVTFTVNHLTKFALINLAGHQTTINANTGAQQVLGEKQFADGSLLKDSSDKHVYLLKNNTLHYIATATELAKYKGKTILIVSHSVILGFAKEVLGAKVYADGTLVRVAGTAKIYVILKGKMVHITSFAQLKKYKGHKIITIAATTGSGY